MTTRPTPVSGAAAVVAPGVTPTTFREGAVSGRQGHPPRRRERTHNMTATQDPRGDNPGGQHSNDGGQRVAVSLPADDLFGVAVQKLARLDDRQLDNFVRDIDAALMDARNGSSEGSTEEVVSIAAAARVMLRRRKQAAAHARALAIVNALISTTETE